MSTPGPADPESTPPPAPPDLDGLDPQALLKIGLDTVPPVTLPPQPVDPNATVAVARPQPTQPAAQVELPLPEELTKLLPGGNYHVESFLGQGGMGAVYKGTQVRLKRPVAIKIMRRDQGRDYDFEARFEREAQAMAKLNHPNIVSVIDYGEAGDDYLYIVMELVDGADLMDVIRTGRMTQEMALTLLPQICDALQFAHDHGIVHRDIKPSNIMLTRDGRIKMADFGLAKRFDAESSFRTQTGTGMGTPDYAAPEQFDAQAPIDHRADIYALGVMIYQMITGTLPRGVWKPPSQRAEIDPHWDDIVSRAMQSDPKDRYQQANEVKTDVSSIPLAGKERSAGTPARPSSKGGEAAKKNKADNSVRAPVKSRAPLIFGVVVGVLVLGIGAFFGMRGKQSSAGLEPAPASTAPGTSKSATSASTPTAEASGDGLKPGTTLAATTALPESGWQPLFTEAEWRASEGDQRVYRDGWLHLADHTITRPRLPSGEGKIRTKIRIAPGTSAPAIVLRDGQTEWRLEVILDSKGKCVEFRVAKGTTGSNAPLRTEVSDKRATAFQDIKDFAVLDLSLSGSSLTASLTGSGNARAGVRTTDEQLPRVSEWGIGATDGWFESVEIQPLPASAAEPWQSMLSDPAKLKFSRQVEVTPEGLRMSENSGANLASSIGSQRDGAVRLRTIYGELRAAIRARMSTVGNYQLYASSENVISLLRFDGSGSTKSNVAVASFRPKKPLKPGQEYELELRVVGQSLTAKLDGEVLGTVSDDALTQGTFGIAAAGSGAPVLVKAFEFLDLDKPAATSSPSPQVSLRDSAATSSDPKFPPGQWVKVFTKFEELPVNIRSMALALGPDGWIDSTAPGTSPVVWLRGTTGRNQGIRLRGKVTPTVKSSTGFVVSVRHTTGARQGGRDYALSVIGMESRPSVQLKYREVGDPTLAMDRPDPPLKPGNEFDMELVVIGDKIYSKFDGKPLPVVTDTNIAQGEMGFQTTHLVRDVEVINLDGLSEAEALRILGVDEKGNDLRGKQSSAGLKPAQPSPTPSAPNSATSTSTPATQPAGDGLKPGTTFATATKENPFTNTLGMKFVPVPGTQVLFSIWHTRVQDYAAFAKAQEAVGKKVDGAWKTQAKEGVPAGHEKDHPVVGVGWGEAQAFCKWLTERETAAGALPKGAKYRLPTDAEWSTAVGLPPEQGETPEEKDEKGQNDMIFPWGKEWPPSKTVGNYADESFQAKFPVKKDGKMENEQWMKGYNDGYATTSPVGAFPANAYGLYDMGGNVWQWCEDWWNAEHKDRVLRGWCFADHVSGNLRSSRRTRSVPAWRGGNYGFRCVLEPAPSAAAAAPGK